MSIPCVLNANPLPLDEYRARISDSIVLTQSGNGVVPEEQASILRDRFPRGLQVSTGDKIFTLDHTLLGAWIDLAENSVDGREKLLRHLKALLEQFDPVAESPFLGSSWEISRAALEEVYRGGEFRSLEEKPPGWGIWLMQMLERVARWIRAHIPAIGGSTLVWTTYAMIALLLIAGLILIVWIIRSAGRLGRRGRRPASEGDHGSMPLPEDWLSLRSEAERKAGEGALREAVRCFFLSVLWEGHSKGWWVYRPESTNREHLSVIEGGERRRNAFERLADLYERSWYGLNDPGREDFESCKNLLQSMETAG